MMLPPRLTALRPVAAAWLILAVVTTAAAVAIGGWDARGPIDGLRSSKLAAAMGLLTAVTLWPWVRWGRSPLAATWLIAAGSLLRVAGTVALFLVASYQWATPNSSAADPARGPLVAAAWVLTWYVTLLIAEVVALSRYLNSRQLNSSTPESFAE